MAYLEVGRIYAVVGIATLVRVVRLRGKRVVVRSPAGIEVSVTALQEFRRATVAQERDYWKAAYERIAGR